MDWSTILASAGISAIVGTFVSLVAVSQVTTRTARAERRDRSRLAVRSLVTPMLRDVIQYRAGINSGQQRSEKLRHAEDYVVAAKILAAGADLGFVQRWLLRRRCSRVLGDPNTELAELVPPREDNGWTLTPILAAGIARPSVKTSWERQSPGMLHTALVGEPDSQGLRTLVRELKKLAACR